VTEPAASAGLPTDTHRTSTRPGLRRTVRIAAVTGLCTTLLVVAGALAPHGFALSEGQTTQRLVRVTDYLLVLAGLAVALAAVAVLVASSASGIGMRPGMRRRTRPPWWTYLLAYLVALVVIVMLSRALDSRRETSDPRPRDEPRQTESQEEVFARPDAFAKTLVVITAGLLLTGGAFYILRRGRQQVTGTRPRAVPEVLADEIDAGIDHLRTDGDPRAAVIACYLRMERALARAGISRRPSETPFELLERALREHSVLGRSAHRLTALFEVARFSLHPVGERERRHAIDALGEVRSQLAIAQ
jgi:hypothetical protein